MVIYNSMNNNNKTLDKYNRRLLPERYYCGGGGTSLGHLRKFLQNLIRNRGIYSTQKCVILHSEEAFPLNDNTYDC